MNDAMQLNLKVNSAQTADTSAFVRISSAREAIGIAATGRPRDSRNESI